MTPDTCRTLPYPVHVGSALLSALPTLVPELSRAHRIGIVTDETVAPLWAGQVADILGRERTTIQTIPPGEAQKTRETWAGITDALLAAGFGRDSLLIAVGGGVVCDLTGFTAATFMRGIPVLHIPTTLLAMVDAAIGGKTGVDTPAGKNLVGAFHPPVAVVCDLDTLRTLPAAERVNGMAEAIKHGVIASAAYFDTVAASAQGAPDWHAIVAGSVAIKAGVVAADEREHGLRKILNFGHTIGHAIEQLLQYRLPHGQCVAIGMMVETRIAIALGLCDAALAPALQSALAHAHLPTSLPAHLDPSVIVDATAGDKKSRAGTVEYALPARCGAMAGEAQGYGIPVPREVVIAALRAT